jgi:hypothetical protein
MVGFEPGTSCPLVRDPSHNATAAPQIFHLLQTFKYFKPLLSHFAMKLFSVHSFSKAIPDDLQLPLISTFPLSTVI